MKPFDAEELQVRVKNLVVQRQRIREHFKKQGIINLSDKKIVSVDKIFLKKATKIIGIDPQNLRILDYRVRWFPENRQKILEDLIVIKKEINPDLVFLPSSFDIHQDHKTINNEGIRAFKNCSILGYEFIWNNFSFTSNLFIPVEEKHVIKKIEAVQAYESQQSRFYAADKLVKGLANFRGLQISREYAEAFEVLRWIV